MDRVDGVQVGQGARDLEQAVGGAQGQAETFAGAFQPLLVVVAEAAVLTQLLEVEKGIGAALALLLPLLDSGPGQRLRLAFTRLRGAALLVLPLWQRSKGQATSLSPLWTLYWLALLLWTLFGQNPDNPRHLAPLTLLGIVLAALCGKLAMAAGWLS